jgi:lipopolysaccharide export system protein LptA
MNNLKISLITIITTICFFSICPTFAKSQTQTDKVSTQNSGPINIKSDSLELSDKQRILTFTGDVDIRMDDMVVNCEKVIMYYKDSSNIPNKSELRNNLDKFVAEGNVRISQTGGIFATADRVIYTLADEKLLLTGNAVVRQEKQSMSGSSITVFLKEDRFIVEKAEATLYPDRGNK